MNFRAALTVAVCVIGLTASFQCLQVLSWAEDRAAAAEENSQDEDQSKIDHGKYLVHHVAHCSLCHTPRNEEGELISSRLLSGAAIPIQAPARFNPWAAQSASIAGLGNYDREFVVYLLTEGRRPDGSQPKNPMPSFQMKPDDAQAVVAYLESL